MSVSCPLAMFAGKQKLCEEDCRFCPPEDLYEIRRNTEYFQCLNYTDTFVDGISQSGLYSIADAIDKATGLVIESMGVER